MWITRTLTTCSGKSKTNPRPYHLSYPISTWLLLKLKLRQGVLFPMISSKKLMALVRKWKTMAGIATRTITIPRIDPKVARAGHFVVYSLDERRFVVPLACLHTNIFQELFRLSEEEFGLPSDGPITLSCDAEVLEYAISLVQRSISEIPEKALFVLLDSDQNSSTVASHESC